MIHQPLVALGPGRRKRFFAFGIGPMLFLEKSASFAALLWRSIADAGPEGYVRV